MTQAFTSRGAALLLNLTSWRWAYDFDAASLSTRAKLERMRIAIAASKQFNSDRRLDAEFEYALLDCDSLLALPCLEGEAAEREMVAQRMARIRRVIAYHEGLLARLNRRFWWIPFSIGLATMLALCVSDLARLFSGLTP